jgi:hypothetical protein
VKGSQKIQALINETIKRFSVNQPSASIADLLKINAELSKLDSSDIYIKTKKEEVKDLLVQCAGLWFETNPATFQGLPEIRRQ